MDEQHYLDLTQSAEAMREHRERAARACGKIDPALPLKVARTMEGVALEKVIWTPRRYTNVLNVGL